MGFEFDFRLHDDPSVLVGTQYFELVPGPYDGKHWGREARFIHEYTFAVIEGVFEKHAPNYDHFAIVEITRAQWALILGGLVKLRSDLTQAAESYRVTLPCGRTLNVQSSFELNWRANQHSLTTLLSDLELWLHQTLMKCEMVSVLGL